MRIVLMIAVFCVSLLGAKDLRVFGMSPPITGLLEILYPQGIIGLNYKPYPEDLPYMPKNASTLPVLGGIMQGNPTSFETLVALKPDIVFFPKGTAPEVMKPYSKLGIQTIEVEAWDLEKVDETIEQMGVALGIQERAKRLAEVVRANRKFLEQKNAQVTKRPKIYFALGEGLSTSCAKEGEEDLAYKIGGVNAISCSDFSNSGSFVNVNLETLALKDPDIIFVREIGLYKRFLQNPPKQWQILSAVKNKKLYYAPSTPSNWLMKPPTVMQTIGRIWAFAKVQPELVSDAEAQKIAQDFFLEFLSPLSDEEFKHIEGK